MRCFSVDVEEKIKVQSKATFENPGSKCSGSDGATSHLRMNNRRFLELVGFKRTASFFVHSSLSQLAIKQTLAMVRLWRTKTSAIEITSRLRSFATRTRMNAGYTACMYSFHS